ncbi:MAG: hypothetical protein Q4C49_00565 [Bacillota bacterium]|nr:hypothetical protein [Bacillota bacterium]
MEKFEVVTFKEVQGAEYDYTISYKLTDPGSVDNALQHVYTEITRNRFGNIIVSADSNDLFESLNLSKDARDHTIALKTEEGSDELSKEYIDNLSSIIDNLPDITVPSGASAPAGAPPAPPAPPASPSGSSGSGPVPPTPPTPPVPPTPPTPPTGGSSGSGSSGSTGGGPASPSGSSSGSGAAPAALPPAAPRGGAPAVTPDTGEALEDDPETPASKKITTELKNAGIDNFVIFQSWYFRPGVSEDVIEEIRKGTDSIEDVLNAHGAQDSELSTFLTLLKTAASGKSIKISGKAFDFRQLMYEGKFYRDIINKSPGWSVEKRNEALLLLYKHFIRAVRSSAN